MGILDHCGLTKISNCFLRHVFIFLPFAIDLKLSIIRIKKFDGKIFLKTKKIYSLALFLKS